MRGCLASQQLVSFAAPESLQLKVGAQVILLKVPTPTDFSIGPSLTLLFPHELLFHALPSSSKLLFALLCNSHIMPPPPPPPPPNPLQTKIPP